MEISRTDTPCPLHISSMGPRVLCISVRTPRKGLVFPALLLAQFTVVICLDDIRMETGKVPAVQSLPLPLAVKVQDPRRLHQGSKWPAEGLSAHIGGKCKRGRRGCWEDQGHPLMSLGSLSPSTGHSSYWQATARDTVWAEPDTPGN